MGGVIDSVFGGGAAKATRKSLSFIKDIYNENKQLALPWQNAGMQSYQTFNNMLGGPGQDQAFQNWLNSSDYQFTTKQGLDAITQNMASKGLLNSGSTLKAITQFGQDNAQQYRNNYMNELMASAGLGAGVLGNLMGSGTQAGANYANTALQGAQQKSQTWGNFLNFGLGVAGLISDKRLKTDIKRVGRMDKGKGGLPVYTYRYVDDPENVRRMGVMAQDVAKKRPEALGPAFDNFMTVNYKELANG